MFRVWGRIIKNNHLVRDMLHVLMHRKCVVPRKFMLPWMSSATPLICQNRSG